ncbi:glycosyltransferase family 39 protein [Candidatus Bathyarchaeota archaeon]|nr:glycosyltransferase family 39 protein [Candidatus Bathyarchaeota archaeon]
MRLWVHIPSKNEVFIKEYSIGQGYYSWNRFRIGITTDQIKLSLDYSNAKIFEVVAINASGDLVKIEKIDFEGLDKSCVKNLFDEQECFENPPTFLSETYFDEIYFVRTAQEFLDNEKPYEWTHPPLGKLIIASGIAFFSFSPFGWRLIGVLFATLMIPVVYIFAKKVFNSITAAAISSLLLTFDFLHFTMARIGTVDTFLVFFSLMSTLFFYLNFDSLWNTGRPSYKSIFFGVLFFFLALAVKWTALYGLVGHFILFLALSLRNFSEKRVIQRLGSILYSTLKIFAFFVIGGCIYLSTFVPYLAIGDDLVDIYEAHWRMYFYHAGLNATHPFSSEWWMWPLMIKPLWLFYAELPNGVVSTIVALGNPAIWWVGFPLIFLGLWIGLGRMQAAYLFPASIFLFQWIPYIFIQRCLFIYHYYPCVPLMILASSGFLSECWDNPKNRCAVKIYLIAVVLAFVLFYPVISGYPIPLWYKESLKLFRSWIF